MGALCLCLGLLTRLRRDGLFEEGAMLMPFKENIRELMREHVYGKTAGERLKHIKCNLFFG